MRGNYIIITSQETLNNIAKVVDRDLRLDYTRITKECTMYSVNESNNDKSWLMNEFVLEERNNNFYLFNLEKEDIAKTFFMSGDLS